MKTFKLSAAAAVIALGAGLVSCHRLPKPVPAPGHGRTVLSRAQMAESTRPIGRDIEITITGLVTAIVRHLVMATDRRLDITTAVSIPGAAAAAGIVGLTTGAIVGGALSQQAAPSYGCTYLGRDGYRHACR